MSTKAKTLTEAQLKVLRDMATSGGTSGPPGGYREAGRDASRWWRSVAILRERGLVERLADKHGNARDGGVHKITKAGCLAIGLTNGVSNLGFPEEYLVCGPCCWGAGDTIEAATKVARKENRSGGGGRPRFPFKVLSVYRYQRGTDVKIDETGTISWPKGVKVERLDSSPLLHNDVWLSLSPGGGGPAQPCDRCSDAEVEIRISATDLDGVVLDYEKVCRQCATDAGFTVGKREPKEVGSKSATKGGRS